MIASGYGSVRKHPRIQLPESSPPYACATVRGGAPAEPIPALCHVLRGMETDAALPVATCIAMLRLRLEICGVFDACLDAVVVGCIQACVSFCEDQLVAPVEAAVSCLGMFAGVYSSMEYEPLPITHLAQKQ